MREDLFKKGKVEYKAGRFRNAANLFLAAIRADQENAAWKSLGMSHSHPNDFAAWYALGRCLMKMNKKEKAVKCFRNAIQISRDCIRCQNALMDTTRIPLSEKKNQFLKKIDTFLEARIWCPVLESFHSLWKPVWEVEVSDVGRKKTFFSFWKKATGADLSNPLSEREIKPKIQMGYPSARQATRFPSNTDVYSCQDNIENLMREQNEDVARTLAERRRQSEDEEIEELIALGLTQFTERSLAYKSDY